MNEINEPARCLYENEKNGQLPPLICEGLLMSKKKKKKASAYDSQFSVVLLVRGYLAATCR